MDTQDDIANAQGSATTDTGGAGILINLEGLIKSHLSSIDRLEEELSKHKGMLEDIFNNNPTYKDHAEKAKEAAKIKSATKQQIMKQPQVGSLAQKVKNMSSELKELKSSLSDYLKEYQRMSGVDEIEGDDGEVRQIIYTAKLVKKMVAF